MLVRYSWYARTAKATPAALGMAAPIQNDRSFPLVIVAAMAANEQRKAAIRSKATIATKSDAVLAAPTTDAIIAVASSIRRIEN